MSRSDNICLDCGACCATYRVSFYWAEADDAPGGTVPVALTQGLTPLMRCMQGTSQSAPRCVALEGEIGQRVGCRIYAQRPSPCHAVEAGDPQCLKARARHGLPPLPAGVRPQHAA
ncbi:YkgJ family cysteine cluster protein [Aquabacterium fontiphilum]|jgi:Fe-S-cluster containining protein|uniref:YkgJ family cysteine cluster protein n=1 Tax=Aquabacterium fontiphilum TaxID=450365 RepID=UPI001376BD06|nr:YkgJ family cysteine cluster protein [Aquabacterium fontiphilum]NBD20168.1 YkgJ family cysteine cluster protein [Aquabacterium fontiphilum]